MGTLIPERVEQSLRFGCHHTASLHGKGSIDRA
jgi:hypothetical protein